MADISAIQKLGIIAGNGVYPQLLLEKIKSHPQIQPFIIRFVDETVLSQEVLTSPSQLVYPGQLKKVFSFFTKHQCTHIIFAGGLKKRKWITQIRPDFLALKLLTQLKRTSDDHLLSKIATLFEEKGMEVISGTTFLPELFCPQGLICGQALSSELLENIDYAQEAAKTLSPLDIGQTIIIAKKSLVAVEAIEGTDACIKRSAALLINKKEIAKSIIYKSAKKNQDLRFDAPAIGPNTIVNMANLGFKTLILESPHTLVFDIQKCIQIADSNNITIYGLENNKEEHE